MENIEKGIYRHYKGNTYEVIDTALNSETEEVFVIYRALYESKFGKNVLWIRPIKMFKEMVFVNGKETPRFQHIKNNEGEV